MDVIMSSEFLACFVSIISKISAWWYYCLCFDNIKMIHPRSVPLACSNELCLCLRSKFCFERIK